ncbi:hypothetical protein ODJ79_25160 [Actinoplanes sp. KI2]|uniref:hypothetical protein n=1 Tax=Actinoplanes sp. KI2 TaxID=2983315 RepID=UPI0021D59959|nr:hypothetical protein [Actinoplanes sp. KI2]MCU7727031.1 hypothetical protein [Actinoplanes sp. KI2]
MRLLTRPAAASAVLPAACGVLPAACAVPLAACVMLLAACAVLLAACGTAPGEAQILAPWAASAPGVVFAPSGATRVVGSVGQMAFCLDRPGAARVDRVVPHVVAGSLRIDRFWVQSAGSGGGAGTVVDHTCPRAGRRATRAELSTMVFLQLRVVQLAEVSTVVDAFVLEYTSDGVQLSYTLPWGLTVCVPGDAATPLCDPQG